MSKPLSARWFVVVRHGEDAAFAEGVSGLEGRLTANGEEQAWAAASLVALLGTLSIGADRWPESSVPDQLARIVSPVQGSAAEFANRMFDMLSSLIAQGYAGHLGRVVLYQTPAMNGIGTGGRSIAELTLLSPDFRQQMGAWIEGGLDQQPELPSGYGCESSADFRARLEGVHRRLIHGSNKPPDTDPLAVPAHITVVVAKSSTWQFFTHELGAHVGEPRPVNPDNPRASQRHVASLPGQYAVWRIVEHPGNTYSAWPQTLAATMDEPPFESPESVQM